MMKQPPYVTRLRLSRICRWLLALGLLKLCIFGALVAGYPLPEISLDFGGRQDAAPVDKSAAAPAVAALDATGATPADPLAGAHADAPHARPEAEPQGADAARAAAAVRPGLRIPLPAVSAEDMAVKAPTAPDSPLAPLLAQIPTHQTAQAPAAQTPADHAPAVQAPVVQTAAPEVQPDATAALQTGEKPQTTASGPDGWWNNILELKRLPFPRLGVDQAAHAATLDMPPPPRVSGAQENSPFVPPDMNIPRGQNPDGTPLPPRSTTARPLPAGAAGPQSDAGGNLPSYLVPNDKPPAPRVDAYTSPDDPNRKRQELARKEQEVLMLQQQMEQRLQELHNAEQKVQGMLREAKDVEAQKVGSLAAMYINMKPKVAAKALESLDERTAVRILSGMTPKQSGEILTYMDPARTAKLTELIGQMRIEQ